MIAWLLRLAGYRLEKIVKQPLRPFSCGAQQHSDQMVCQECDQAWDVNDTYPPVCNPVVLKDRKSRMNSVYGRITVHPPAPPPPAVVCRVKQGWGCKHCNVTRDCPNLKPK